MLFVIKKCFWFDFFLIIQKKKENIKAKYKSSSKKVFSIWPKFLHVFKKEKGNSYKHIICFSCLFYINLYSLYLITILVFIFSFFF